MFKTVNRLYWLVLLILMAALSFSVMPALAQEEVCEVYVDETYTLWAGQDIDSGTVTLSFDGEILSVTYNTSGGWLLGTVHAAAATNLAELTGNNGNRLPPGQLAALNTDTAVGGSADGAGGTSVTVELTLTQTMLDGIGTDGFEFYVVAHAEVYTVDDNNNVVDEETGYGGNDGDGDENNWWYYMLYSFETDCDDDPPEESGNGCTPGYWKNHPEDWTGHPEKSVSEWFSSTPAANDVTTMSALQGGGGPGIDGAIKILLRAATAGYLNSLYVEGYPMTTYQLMTAVNAALDSNDRETMLELAETIDGYNNGGCTLGGPNVDGPANGGDNGDGDTNGDTGDNGDTGSSDEPKVPICHIPPGNPSAAHVIMVPLSAVPGHLGHGDVEGACPDDLPEKERGKSGDKGKKDK